MDLERRQLGLTGKAKPVEFLHVLRGLSPDGQTEWVKNAKTGPVEYTAKDGSKKVRERHLADDWTLTPPKSFPVFVICADVKERETAIDCHRAARDKALAYIERTCVLTRTGRGGKNIEHASPIVAAFTHLESREGDMNYHEHLVFMNVCLCKDGTTRAVHNTAFFTHAKTIDQIYKTELGYQLMKAPWARA